MKTKMKIGKYYCYHISSVCMVFCKIIEVGERGYFMSSYRPTQTNNPIPYWLSHGFYDNCISDVVPISKSLYESTRKIIKKRKTLSTVFR